MAIKLGIVSLSGGQAKTTTARIIGVILAKSYKTLLIDCDPQANLSMFCGHTLSEGQPSIFEVIRRTKSLEDAVLTTDRNNLYLLPSDPAFNDIETYLSRPTVGVSILDRILRKVEANYDYIIVDTPPADMHIWGMGISACDYLLITCSLDKKGETALVATVDAIDRYAESELFEGEILGILPVFQYFHGPYISTTSKESLTRIKEGNIDESGEPIYHMFPPTRFRQKSFSQALRHMMIPSEMPGGYADDENPIHEVIARLVDLGSHRGGR
jgi:chromosome partitioning protein